MHEHGKVIYDLEIVPLWNIGTMPMGVEARHMIRLLGE